MAVNENTVGESVYTSIPIESRAEHPLYAAVGELIQRHSMTGRVADIGCSDGVATLNLSPDYKVFGVDLSQSALEANNNQHVIRGDMRSLPLSPNARIDTALILDVAEHEPYDESMLALAGMKDVLTRDHTLIVNMPIISALSMETWREFAEVVRNRERPEAGLFDRTHQILASRNGHISLFQDSGYDVIEEYQTNKLEGITGSWSFKEPIPVPDREELQGKEGLDRALTFARLMSRTLYGGRRNLLNDEAVRAYFKSQEVGSPKIAKLGKALVAYQGLYVLKPVYR